MGAASPVPGRPTWIEIDRAKLKANCLKLRKRLARGTELLAVVKADAYGHGAAVVSRCLEGTGIRYFGVSSIEEGISLRKTPLKKNILILGSAYPFKGSFQAARRYNLELTLSSAGAAKELVSYLSAPSRKRAALKVHIKIESGMQRIGARPATALQMAKILSRCPRVRLAGLYTHFAAAKDAAYTRRQLEEFLSGVNMIRKEIPFRQAPLLHAANSAAAIRRPETHLDMVRSGIALYGGAASFDPIASFKSRIVFLKKVPAGTSISYERLFTAQRASWIATIPAGYADGLPATASSRAQVLIRGRRYQVTGLITMDMLMVDVTDAPTVKVGDVVTLLGRDGREAIGPAEWAKWSRMSIYQFFCHLGGMRTPKVYVH